MDGDRLYSIGDLARRSGLAVRTIRFYSDRGIVAPAGHSPAGYRLYDVDAVARLDLVRTLRELDVDLPTIRKVVHRELSLPAVAAGRPGRRGTDGTLRAHPRPPRRRQAPASAAGQAGSGERSPQRAVSHAPRSDQRLVGPGEPDTGTRLVHPGPGCPNPRIAAR